MTAALLQALIASENEAADDLLSQAVAIGNDDEKNAALDALFKRATVRGLCAIVASYDALPDALKLKVLENIKPLHPALRECGRSQDVHRRKSALKLIALGRQGKLAYVLSENLHDQNEELSKAAVDALVGLARWVATETKRLQSSSAKDEPPAVDPGTRTADPDRAAYQNLIDQRP